MSAAIDVEQCAGCAVVNLCDWWVPGGSWKHQEGVEPCRPVPENKSRTRPRIIEEPIPTARAKSCKGCIAEGTCTPDRMALCGGKYYCKPAGPVIDAEQEQRAKFSLRSMK